MLLSWFSVQKREIKNATRWPSVGLLSYTSLNSLGIKHYYIIVHICNKQKLVLPAPPKGSKLKTKCQDIHPICKNKINSTETFPKIQQFLLLLLTAKSAADLDSCLCWGKPTVPPFVTFNQPPTLCRSTSCSSIRDSTHILSFFKYPWDTHLLQWSNTKKCTIKKKIAKILQMCSFIIELPCFLQP
jgi:hypothetical protein